MTIINSSAPRQYFVDEASFRATLNELNSASSLWVNSQGDLVPSSVLNLFNPSIVKDQRLVELKIMEFLVQGKKWLKSDDINLIDDLVSKVGLLMKKPDQGTRHKELRSLINLLVKDILKYKSVSSKEYSKIYQDFQKRYSRILAPYSEQCEQVRKSFEEAIKTQNETSATIFDKLVGSTLPKTEVRTPAAPKGHDLHPLADKIGMYVKPFLGFAVLAGGSAAAALQYFSKVKTPIKQISTPPVVKPPVTTTPIVETVTRVVTSETGGGYGMGTYIVGGVFLGAVTFLGYLYRQGHLSGIQVGQIGQKVTQFKDGASTLIQQGVDKTTKLAGGWKTGIKTKYDEVSLGVSEKWKQYTTKPSQTKVTDHTEKEKEKNTSLEGHNDDTNTKTGDENGKLLENQVNDDSDKITGEDDKENLLEDQGKDDPNKATGNGQPSLDGENQIKNLKTETKNEETIESQKKTEQENENQYYFFDPRGWDLAYLNPFGKKEINAVEEIKKAKGELGSIAVDVFNIRKEQTKNTDPRKEQTKNTDPEDVVNLLKRIGPTAKVIFELSLEKPFAISQKDLEFIKSGLKLCIHELDKELTGRTEEDITLRNHTRLHREILSYENQDLIDLIYIYLDSRVTTGGTKESANGQDAAKRELKNRIDGKEPNQIELTILETTMPKEGLFILSQMSKMANLKEENVRNLAKPDWVVDEKEFVKQCNGFADELEGWSKLLKSIENKEILEDWMKDDKRLQGKLYDSTMDNLHRLKNYFPEDYFTNQNLQAQNLQATTIENEEWIKLNSKELKTFLENVENTKLTITNSKNS